MKNNVPLYVGGHHSIRTGFAGAALTAMKQGGNCYQFFSKNPRSLTVKDFDKAEATKCKKICRENDILSVIHTPYPSNLAVETNASDDQFNRTTASLKNDLEISEACGSIGIIVHFGIYKGINLLQGYQNIIQCINKVLSHWQGKSMLLLENQAGDHGDMGITIEELTKIRSLCEKPEYVGFCLDTCHAFASGMWVGDQDNNFVQKAQEYNFWADVKCIHFNDSQYPALSRKDRHARPGEGFIGQKGFEYFLSIPEVRTKPMIIESRTGRDGTYREDIEKVRRWGERQNC
ncbi:deoxyribonuclease IV [Paenibacillus turicensis]|nr:deoxyribonuclease IV [Paenibacillus turicensis]